MLKIFSVEEAQKSILKRENAFFFADPEMTEAQKEAATALYGKPLSPDEAVRHILNDVRKRGDEALAHWTQTFDGGVPDRLAISNEELSAALDRIEPELRHALETAAGRIRDFHERQPLPNWTTSEMGGTIGQRVTPIERVGVYVPGGTAPLPSTMLMCAIPAQVAGVKDLIAVTPPGKDGKVPDVILAAAAIAGVDQVLAMGGAQAIGALAFGTETIQKVDKIVGPGSLWVTLAKRQVYGIVGIDGLYGPTETAVVADETADAAWVAADLLAQAEHDVLASAILFTPSVQFAGKVQIEVGRQTEELSRAEIIVQSLASQGGVVITKDMDEACQLASQYAAEHTCIAIGTPEKWIEKIPNAGGLFVGEHSFEVLGDYVAGPSHTMPTNATARFASPLNVADFVKISSIINIDPETARQLAPVAARIAQAEGLDGHAAAALKRINSS
ncbi:MAG: histidinol dehydrogenase [Chloroflexota bacterium]